MISFIYYSKKMNDPTQPQNDDTGFEMYEPEMYQPESIDISEFPTIQFEPYELQPHEVETFEPYELQPHEVETFDLSTFPVMKFEEWREPTEPKTEPE